MSIDYYQCAEGLGGCPWPLDVDCIKTAWDGIEGSIQEYAAALAGTVLHHLTGGRVGGCPITVRPVPRAGVCYMPPRTTRSDSWVGVSSGGSAIALVPPVVSVDQVEIEGVVLDPSEYRLSGFQLRRSSGESWPAQNLDLPAGEPGTWSVTYNQTYPVSQAGARAAALLALEFAKACSEDMDCALPPNVVSITRSGVSYQMAGGVFPDGVTGIKAVDAWVATWNPKHLVSRPIAWSPDVTIDVEHGTVVTP